MNRRKPIEPPQKLSRLLQRVRLITPERLRRYGPLAGRLSRGVPLFESVWIDALVRCRAISPMQANWIHLGQGEQLRLGSYLLIRKLDSLGYADRYHARLGDSRVDATLLVARQADHANVAYHEEPSQWPSPELAGHLDDMVAKARDLCDHMAETTRAEHWSSHRRHAYGLALPTAWGCDDDRLWIAMPPVEGGPDGGMSAEEYLVTYGRLAPSTVLQIARQTISTLAVMHDFRLLHGDISARNLILTRSGHATLVGGGIRPILRPVEGFSRADLPPRFYEGIAPERVMHCRPIDVRSEIFALGSLWWQLLTGRPAIPGGDTLTRMRNIASRHVPDIRHHVPELPEPLYEAITLATQSEPAARPGSIHELIEILEPNSLRQQHAPLATESFGQDEDSFRDRAVERTVGSSVSSEKFRTVLTDLPQEFTAPIRWSGNRSVWTALQSRAAETFAGEPYRGAVQQHEKRRRPGMVVMLAVLLIGCLIGYSISGVQRPHGNASSHNKQHDVVANTTANTIASSIAGSTARTLTASSRQVNSNDRTEPDPGMSVNMPVISSPGNVTPVVSPSAAPSPDSPVVELPTDQPIDVSELTIRPGSVFRGQLQQHATILIRQQPLVISESCVEVRFEYVDFVLHGQSDTAMILENRSATFEHCSFLGPTDTQRSVTAIDWSYPQGDDPMRMSSGSLTLRDCRFSNVADGVQCRMHGAKLISCSNVLYRGNGAMLQSNDCPQPGESLTLMLHRVTLRGPGSLLTIACPGATDDGCGRVAIRAEQCVLAPDAQQPIIGVESDTPDACESLLQAIEWVGRDSIAESGCTVVGWFRDRQSRPQPLDDSALKISGLVRGQVVFSDTPADASRVVDWLAPLHEDSPPGYRPE